MIKKIAIISLLICTNVISCEKYESVMYAGKIDNNTYFEVIKTLNVIHVRMGAQNNLRYVTVCQTYWSEEPFGSTTIEIDEVGFFESFFSKRPTKDFKFPCAKAIFEKKAVPTYGGKPIEVTNDGGMMEAFLKDYALSMLAKKYIEENKLLG